MDIVDPKGPVRVVELVNETDLQGAQGAQGPTGPQAPPSIVLENPSDAEDASWWYAFDSVTVSALRVVLRGTTPSVTWTIRHDSDRSAAGTEVVTGGTTTTNTTTGEIVTTFNNAAIPGGSYVWVETTANSGTVNEIQIAMQLS